MSRARRIKVGLLAVAGLLALATGLGVADHLPDAAQEAVANAFERAGIEGLVSHPEVGPPDGPGVLQEGVGEDVSEAATGDYESGTDRASAVLDATGQSGVPDSVPAGEENGNNAEISGGANAATHSEAGSEAANQGAENAERRGPPSDSD